LKNTHAGVIANYVDPGLEEYRGNPLIEALPKIWEDDIDLAKSLVSRPTHSQADLVLPPPIRMHAIARILNGGFFHPLPSHLNLEKKLSLMIRTGYIKRNPALNQDKQLLQENYLRSQGKQGSIKLFPTTDRAVDSTRLIGCSGSGKTTAVKKVLSTYPQLIEHPKYNMLQQLTYVIAECPYNGSVASLCSNFFHAVDSVLGTTYHRRYTQQVRIGEKTLLQAMTQMAIEHSIGVLVIDEIQHLQDTKDNRDELLNFFTELTNTIGIPILLIGTPKASGISKDLRGARRLIGFGSMEWGISKTDNDMMLWRGFLKRLWRFQWVQKRSKEPSEDIIEHLFILSQGIIDITIKLFVIAQIRAIVSKAEELTIPLFDTVYAEEMKSVHPMLDALRSGNVEQIARYSDLTVPEVDIPQIASNVAHPIDDEDLESENVPIDSELQLLLKFFKIDYKQHTTEIALLREEHPDIDETTLAKKLIAEIEASTKGLKAIKAKEQGPKTNVIPYSKWGKLDHDDLRYIHSQSHTESEMHTNLVKNGLIAAIK
jgi:hypothetical protein